MGWNGGCATVVVVIKPTTACNARCRYCASDGGAGREALTADRLPELFAPFAVWLAAHPDERLSWIWHGGEPMLLGTAFYSRVARVQREVFGPDATRVRNMMQTNLSLLTEEWVGPLKELMGRGSLGTSFDPVPGWRLMGDCGGALSLAYDDAWLAAVDLLRRARVRYGTVYVVHRQSLPLARQIYLFFRNQDAAAGVRFNPLYAEGRAASDALGDAQVSPEEYGRFLVELLDAWAADGRRLAVMPLREWADAWLGEAGALCCDSRGECSRTHLGIAPDGSVFGCGRGIDSATPCHGNVFTDTIDAILAHPDRARLAGRAATLREGACGRCEWWDLCHGGCPNDALLAHGDPMRETQWCASRRIVFESLGERLGPRRPPHMATPPVQEETSGPRNGGSDGEAPASAQAGGRGADG